ncbi:MAG: alanine racemase [Rhodobacteraceae bacterium]|nr:alanine racemase [Paracoccaceae bacterium]
MARALLHIDLDAITANWRALDAHSAPGTRTAATIKADAYGLGAAQVGPALMAAGVHDFFVAIAEEGVALRKLLGPEARIHVYSGHMAGDSAAIRGAGLVPMLNCIDQMTRHFEILPGHPFGIQLDTGMNRLGMEPAEWAAVAELVLEQAPVLVMSHLACADEPDHPMNAHQLQVFHALTDGIGVPRSLAATGGVLLGPAYHFDMTRPGIGLYGGRPFEDARPVARLSLPVIQTRELEAGETVGYGNTFAAPAPMRLATLAAGYADGIHRVLSGQPMLYHGATPCPLVGRVSMDLLTVDISALSEPPRALDLICPAQGIDALADMAGTIGYEILTALGPRYAREYGAPGKR